jgi:hypothetical protein
MWGNTQQPAPLAARFQNQVQMSMLEVSHTAVHEARGPAGRSAGKVFAFEKTYAQATERRVARDTNACDAATNDDKIEWLLGATHPGGRPPRRREPNA